MDEEQVTLNLGATLIGLFIADALLTVLGLSLRLSEVQVVVAFLLSEIGIAALAPLTVLKILWVYCLCALARRAPRRWSAVAAGVLLAGVLYTGAIVLHNIYLVGGIR